MVSSRDLTLTGFRSDFNMLRPGPFRPQRYGIPAMGAGFDWHFKSEFQYLRMMELARDVIANDIVIGAAIRRVVKNVVGPGIPVHPETGDEDLDKRLTNWWQTWGDDKFQCHFNQTLTWHKMEGLALRSMIGHGDWFALPTDRGALDLAEGHRCRTPMISVNRSATKRNVVMGVLKDDEGTPQEYWFTARDVGFQQVSTVGEMVRVPVLNDAGQPLVFHVIDEVRSSQTRGITALVPTFDAVGMHNDRQFAELVKANIASCFIWARELQQWAESDQHGTAGEVEIRGSSQATRLFQHIFPGMEVPLRKGEKLVSAMPQVAGADFITHTHLILQFMSINLDCPVAVLLLDAALTNFSGWRGALDQARISWADLQKLLVMTLSAPTYVWKVRQWATEDSDRGRLLRAAIKKGLNVVNHSWHPPGFPYIEPLKDVQADFLEYSSGLNSRRRVLLRKQLNVRQIDEEEVADMLYRARLAMAGARELKKEFPEFNVDWEMFMPGMPRGMTLAVTGDGSQAKGAGAAPAGGKGTQ